MWHQKVSSRSRGRRATTTGVKKLHPGSSSSAGTFLLPERCKQIRRKKEERVWRVSFCKEGRAVLRDGLRFETRFAAKQLPGEDCRYYLKAWICKCQSSWIYQAFVDSQYGEICPRQEAKDPLFSVRIFWRSFGFLFQTHLHVHFWIQWVICTCSIC